MLSQPSALFRPHGGPARRIRVRAATLAHAAILSNPLLICRALVSWIGIDFTNLPRAHSGCRAARLDYTAWLGPDRQGGIDAAGSPVSASPAMLIGLHIAEVLAIRSVARRRPVRTYLRVRPPRPEGGPIGGNTAIRACIPIYMFRRAARVGAVLREPNAR